jgi:uncharacterized protein HemY
MVNIGKSLAVFGLFIFLLGLGIILFSKLKIPFIGRLPGDILIQKKNFVFYFPLTTCLIISIVLSFILYFFFKK